MTVLELGGGFGELAYHLALKREYDPTGRFPGLYEKTVGLG